MLSNMNLLHLICIAQSWTCYLGDFPLPSGLKCSSNLHLLAHATKLLKPSLQCCGANLTSQSLLHAHAQGVKWLVVSVCLSAHLTSKWVVSTTRLSNVAKKLAWFCFKSTLNTGQGCHKYYCFVLTTPINHTYAVYGWPRAFCSCVHLQLRLYYADWQNADTSTAHGVCSTELSFFCFVLFYALFTDAEGSNQLPISAMVMKAPGCQTLDGNGT